ncbi:MAG TPA: bifunctional [glutamine synthetase] adenylyltransferase/[glutamine synthetase]-adenylyl-L-tyrosine phosphorylase [Actinomycetota bacterium]|nr:bifunctional [glutamine synthetase] adenylyltransferase/[glutamine synthetase]-adenylyl-L-tyrosine phosphorylase [Actinomycetota bacterium]
MSDPRAQALARVSRSLSELVSSDDTLRKRLEADEPLPSGDDYLQIIRGAIERDGLAELRREKRRCVAEVAARDSSGEIGLEAVGGALTDLTDACLVAALDATGSSEEVAVIAMGKLGARELNYYSDIDLMFVARDDVAAATKAAETLLRSLGSHSPQGQAFIIDTNLRPEGKSGALVRSLDGFIEYYRRWAKPWEFQALIKARHVGGAGEVGRRFIETTRGYVFASDISQERVAQVRKMKQRVESQATRVDRRSKAEVSDVKLGPGGIRDVEFSAQLLQLVHGPADESVRSSNTLEALRSLTGGGYLADDDGAGLEVAYTWLRMVEHRLQLWQERRVRHIPVAGPELDRLGRAMGFSDAPVASAGERFDARHRAVLADVRSRFERLFYRPMIESLADAGGPRMSAEGLRERLALLGFRDVTRASRTLEGLVSGTSRRAKLMRVLTPALLRSLADSPMPDEGLFHLLRVGEAVEGRLDAFSALRENPPAIASLAAVLGSGRLLGEVLAQVPEELASIAAPQPPAPRDRDRMIHEARASLGWREPQNRLDGLRRFKRREMLRISIADIAGRVDQTEVGTALAALADACLEAALDDPTEPFVVLGLGKLGGRELSYSSDIDVMFVHDGDPQVAEKRAESLLRSIGEVTPEGQAFRIDADLRPEGKKGPLSRSVGSLAEYYERWSEPWEHQALTKARVAAGDAELGATTLDTIAGVAFPDAVRPDMLAQIRHLKARMERERIPRGTDPRRHLKLGPGGMSDIEFAVQIQQLEHGHDLPGLRTPNTMEALAAAGEAELIEAETAAILRDAYEFLARLRNRYFLLVGHPRDSLGTKPEELEALGISMGFRAQPRQELEEMYLRTTRRVRKLTEPLIFG